MKPAAWAIVGLKSNDIRTMHRTADAAEAYIEDMAVSGMPGLPASVLIVPLYRSPTITDAEREAVEWCVEMALLHATDCEEEVATLRGLLERLT